MEMSDTVPVYSISVASKLSGVTVRMLREYEVKGLIKPQRVNGRKMFSPCEIGFIKDLLFYLHDKKMAISGLKEFYSRAACWEIKRCNYQSCPAYGKFDKQCWQIVKSHKKCDPSMCPYCPIFIIKTTYREKETKPISPRAYRKKYSKNI